MPGSSWVAGVQFPNLAFLAVLGPGLVSGFADNDAGGIMTYSVVGAQFGYVDDDDHRYPLCGEPAHQVEHLFVRA